MGFPETGDFWEPAASSGVRLWRAGGAGPLLRALAVLTPTSSSSRPVRSARLAPVRHARPGGIDGQQPGPARPGTMSGRQGPKVVGLTRTTGPCRGRLRA